MNKYKLYFRTVGGAILEVFINDIKIGAYEFYRLKTAGGVDVIYSDIKEKINLSDEEMVDIKRQFKEGTAEMLENKKKFSDYVKEIMKEKDEKGKDNNAKNNKD